MKSDILLMIYANTYRKIGKASIRVRVFLCEGFTLKKN